MKKKLPTESQLDIENTPVELLVTRVKFADWFYTRTGMLLTTEYGEYCYRTFLKGHLITVRSRRT